jgi:hypothetical protein
VPGTRLASICRETPFEGFHYCGYGLDEHFASKLQGAGVVISVHAADAGPEALELAAAARAASCIRFSPPGYGRQPRDVP